MTDHLEVIVPDGRCGAWRIESFKVSPMESKTTMLRALWTGRHDEFVPPGTYKRLVRDRTVVMSNTPMEVRTNTRFIKCAKGHVLINGLGLGMVLTAILGKPEVESVTVIEAASEVIELVAPSFQDPRVRIIHADALSYRPSKEEQYDAVWHDIWDTISTDNLPQMHNLHRKYGRRTTWQASWCRTECERLSR